MFHETEVTNLVNQSFYLPNHLSMSQNYLVNLILKIKYFFSDLIIQSNRNY
jgi:hypothetical protein